MRFFFAHVLLQFLLSQCPEVLGFGVVIDHLPRSALFAMKENEDFSYLTTRPLHRSTFLGISWTAFSLIFPTSPSLAGEDDTTNSSNQGTAARSIQACPMSIQGNPNNCVATSNIRQLDTYTPPWTFESSPTEAFARIKGLMVSDPSFSVIEIDEDALYLKADVQRGALAQDSIEFLVKPDEKVVLFRSSEKNGTGTVSDFGANRKRMEELRKKGGIFDIMGSQLGSADSFDSGDGNGFFGQLKSFYGYQSGEGFEDVLAE